MKLLIAAVAIATLTACGGGGGDSKDLFSLWTRDGDGVRFDFSGGAFSMPSQLALFRANGAQCNCTMTVVGTQDSGNVVINQCYYVAGSASGEPNPKCTIHNGVGSYSKTSDVLTLSGPNGTANFR